MNLICSFDSNCNRYLNSDSNAGSNSMRGQPGKIYALDPRGGLGCFVKCTQEIKPHGLGDIAVLEERSIGVDEASRTAFGSALGENDGKGESVGDGMG